MVAGGCWWLLVVASGGGGVLSCPVLSSGAASGCIESESLKER